MIQVVSQENKELPNQTKSKRIPLSLNPELYALISDLAELQNKPRSRVIVELLEQMQPVLKGVVSGLEKLKKSNDPMSTVKQIGQEMLLDANEMLGDVSKEIKKL